MYNSSQRTEISVEIKTDDSLIVSQVHNYENYNERTIVFNTI